MAHDVAGFVKRLHADKGFLARFAEDPAAVLAQEGLDPKSLALPPRIDAAALSKRLDELFAGKALPAAPAGERLDAQALWDQYGAINWKGSAGSDDPGTVAVVGEPTTVAVAIYGVSIVTSTSSGAGQQHVSVDQMAQLRKLAAHPLEHLSFTVHGPDGSSVAGLSAGVTQALIDRAKGSP